MMNSDFESDTENDIAELQAVLLPASVNASVRHPSDGEHMHNIQDPNIQSTNLDNFSSINSALTLNNMLDNALVQLQTTFISLLSECRIKIEAVQTSLKSYKSDRETKKKSSCRGYYLCGIPYFKDPELFPAPYNPDTIKMKNLSIHNYVNLPRLVAWTAKDKKNLENIIVSLAKAKEKVDVRYNIKKLDIKKESATDSELSEIHKKQYQLSDYFEKIDTLPILNLVESLNEWKEYDWEKIADHPTLNYNANECRSMWLNFLHPSINKASWSHSEQKALMNLILKYSNQNWDAIASELNTNRTGYQCFIYYKMHLSIGQNHFVKWNPEEDEFLVNVVETCRIGEHIPWSKVAFYIENRTKEQIYHRYCHSLKGIKRAGRFSMEEDTVLMAANKQYGRDYNRIAKFLPTRSNLQIRIRLQILQSPMLIPGGNNWTVEDDKKLLNVLSKPYFKNNSTDYSEMSKHIDGKSRSSIRARCNTLNRWMRKHPNKKDLSLIPRRRLPKKQCSYIPDIDLETAVELLEESLKKAPLPIKKTNKVQLEISSGIDLKFIEYFRTQKKNTRSVPTPSSSSIVDVGDVKAILLLLHAKLNRNRVDAQLAGGNHVQHDAAVMKELLSHQAKLPLAPAKSVTVRTYSRKKNIIVPANSSNENIASSSLNIWSDEKIPQPNQITHLIPPSYGTVAAFREIMLQTQAKRRVINSYLTQKCDSHAKLWKARFEALFVWPANMSNIPLNINLDLFLNDERMDLT